MAIATMFLRCLRQAALTGLMALLAVRLALAAGPSTDEGLTRDERGVIVRGDSQSKRIAVLVTGLANGPVLDCLARLGAHASFFVTADELKDPDANSLAKRIITDGHYLGPIEDSHLAQSIAALSELGIAQEGSTIFSLAMASKRAEALGSMGVERVARTPNFDPEAAPLLERAGGVVVELPMAADNDAKAGLGQLSAFCESCTRGGYELVRVDQLCATAMKPTPRDPRYPPHWWTPAPTEGAPTWEILPQAAGVGEVILSKRNELGLLSNFAPTPFTFQDKRYASVEGFWQMMKFPEGPDDPRSTAAGVSWTLSRDEVGQLTAFKAKDAGDEGSRNMGKMGIDWVSFEGEHFPYRPAEPGRQYELIVGAMRAKLDQNPDVKRVLLATGDLVLKPDHHQEESPPAAWRYFQIWSEIRTELQKAK
jgi:hypothetical protein